MFDFLANRKLRSKLFFSLVPLAVMVVAAAPYSSIESKMIDTWYSELIAKDVAALRRLTEARALALQTGLILYKLIAEIDPDRMRMIEAALDKTYSDYRTTVTKATEDSPSRAKQIEAAEALFEKAAADTRPVRAATLAGDNTKAMNLMRGGVDAEIEQARQAMIDLVDELQKSVDQQSEELTRKTHRSILIIWLVIGLGLLTSLGFAHYALQSAVVGELSSLRGSIQDVADGRLDRAIPYVERTNEIGEISRAMRTLQGVAREREAQSWVKGQVATAVQRLQSAGDFKEFADTLLSSISESFDLVYGALFLADETRTRFARVGGFALGAPEESREFGLGEGLVGQAAVERRILTITATDDNHIMISAGISSVAPRYLMLIPVVSPQGVTAVIELAPASPLSHRQQALIDALLPSAAATAEILKGAIASRQLLAELQTQQKSLRDSEANIRVIYESSPDAMMTADRGGRIQRINAEMEKIFGYSRAELIGQPVEILVPERFREGHPAHRALYQANPNQRLMSSSQELYGRRKDGSEFPVEIALSPLQGRLKQ